MAGSREAGRAGGWRSTYGHVGDGNPHYDLSKPLGSADDAFRARADDGSMNPGKVLPAG